MQVGIPRVLSFFYYYPFYRRFLENLDCTVVLSSPTSRMTLEKLAVCPTDEPCISIKLAFPHVAELLERGVDLLFLPSLVSADRSSYYCPKHIGLPAMIRNGFGLSHDYILEAQINWRAGVHHGLDSFLALGNRLGQSRKKTRAALLEAWRVQNRFAREMAEKGLTVPEALEKLAGLKRPVRSAPYSSLARLDRNLRVGVAGHSYVLYDYIGHNLVERLQEYATVLVPEMVGVQDLSRALDEISFGRQLWSFEQLIVGSVQHWIKNRLVDCLVLVSPFECGPEAIIEVFLNEVAEEYSIPLLYLTVDEQTGTAGLVTRLEAFWDTVRESRGLIGSKEVASPVRHEQQPAGKENLPPESGWRQRKIGFPTLGRMGMALADIFGSDMTPAVGPLPITRRTVELGAELAPEFICHPMTVTIGQMRECLEAGADTLVMVGGKGRCRLGWYAEMQEKLLKKAGYRFEMVIINSPLPVLKNWRLFAAAAGSIFGRRPWKEIFNMVRLGYSKAVLLEKAEERLFGLRAREATRGAADRCFDRFVQAAGRASSLPELQGAYRQFEQRVAQIPLDHSVKPLKVRLIGEIYAVYEDFVNHELARFLGSLPGIRIEVEREITAVNWLRHHILYSPALLKRHREVVLAARPYLQEQVGGHGLESVGYTALASREGVDGVIHLWPFTCMPEIIAQSIMTRLAEALEIPVLTIIVNEQSGEAGLRTRLESFCHILQERRYEREAAVTR